LPHAPLCLFPSSGRPRVTVTLRVGTRGSELARVQTGHVADALAAAGGFDIELVHIRTDGDRLTGSLATLGGTGVFAVALREALLAGDCDLAVHSLKDLPTEPVEGLVLGAIPPREDPRDALCARDGLTLADLPAGARVGTGSPRRAAQILAARPDLVVVDIRGNVGTRLGRVAHGDLDAVVLARAGLARLGRLDTITDALEPSVMLPAPGQGALAVERRTADDVPGLLAALAVLDHRSTRLAVTAERALLAHLEAGCAAPVGALARLAGRTLSLDAVVSRTDGSESMRRSAQTDLGAAGDGASDAAELGVRLAQELLETGAGALADLAGPGTRSAGRT
jgi:hydroxymethylbilane synthase